LTVRTLCSRPIVSASLVACALVLTLGAGEVFAIEGAPPWSYAMAHDLMSPYCPGRTLAECPSPQATELRFWILTQAAAGVSEADVHAMLSQRFGDVLLAAPRAEGWGLSAYVIPIAFFVLGGPAIILIIRRLATGGSAARALAAEPACATPDPAIDAELERRLERELGDF
jgi:cytochrome c-type biogenesis protein CcmH/NrfF